jgi:membrane-associated phospholipid phosphatase
MWRFVGLSRAIQTAVPPSLYPAFDLVTTLGGTEFLLLVLAVLYWVGKRRETLTVISFTLVALAAILALKYGLALPRPPAAVRVVALESGPYGFPSGHATAATVVYGGLAVFYDRGRAGRRYLVAGTLIGLVALSRVVIGVHYLGDVLTGILLGAAILTGFRIFVGLRPRLGFSLSAVLSVPALVVTSFGASAFMALGGSLGALVGSRYVDRLPSSDGLTGRLAVIALGVPLTGGMVALLEQFGHSRVVVFVGYAVVSASIILLPSIRPMVVGGRTDG